MTAHMDDNGASLQPMDADPSIPRARLVVACVGLAATAVAIGALGALLGAW